MFSRLRSTIHAAVKEWKYGYLERCERTRKETMRALLYGRALDLLTVEGHNVLTHMGTGWPVSDSDLVRLMSEIECLPDNEMYALAAGMFRFDPKLVARAPVQAFALRNSTRFARMAKAERQRPVAQ
jgi:hypothetical protein